MKNLIYYPCQNHKILLTDFMNIIEYLFYSMLKKNINLMY